MKFSAFKFTPAIALIFLLLTDIPAKSETSSQLMAERASNGLLTASKLDCPTPAEITDLILQEKFEEFEKWAKYYEKQFSKDPLYEAPLVDLYDGIDPENGFLPDKLTKWVNTRPSYISYAARGIYKANQGWVIRGDKYVKDTPPENLYGMHLSHEEAKPDLLTAIKLNKKFSPAYCSLIGVEMAKGDSYGTTSIHDLAVRSIPETYYVRYDYLRSLQPRWGGSFELMQEYADGLDKAVKKNPRIWSLKGEVAAERGKTAWQDKDYNSAIQYYTEALSYGDRKNFLKYRGRLYMLVGQDALALENFQKFRKYDNADKAVTAYIVSLTEKLGMNSPQKNETPNKSFQPTSFWQFRSRPYIPNLP